jgi:hypothetical protein
MAQVIDRDAPAWPIYPWGEWTDGKLRRATKGEDFDCTVDGFRCSVYAHARNHGYIAQVCRVRDDENSVEFRLTKKPKPKKSAAKSRRKARS